MTAKGLGSGSVCAPGGWTLLDTTAHGSGPMSITQATFWNNTTGAASYTLTFTTGANCSGAATAASASGVVVRYTGADGATPIEVSNGGTGNQSTTITAPSATTTIGGDQVVRFFSTGGAVASLSGATYSVAGTASATGVSASTQASAGSTGTATASSAPTSAEWAGETVAIVDSLASLAIKRPATAAANDLVLVSVTAKGLGASGNVCAPDATWKQVGPAATQGSGSGSLTQATFWSIRGSAAAETYRFTFSSSSACSGGSASPTGAPASAIALTYTGADPTTPIDVSGSSMGTGTALSGPNVSTKQGNDRVATFFGAAATSVTAGSSPSVNTAGSATATSAGDTTQLQSGLPAGGPPTATASPSGNWAVQTVAIRDLRTSITVNRPSNAAFGDYLIVSVTTESLGGGTVCAPDSSWSKIMTTTSGTGAAAVTQTTFGSFRNSTAAESYSFNFAGGASCASAATAVPATAVAVRYTGVDPTTPVDTGATANQANTGSGTALTAPAVTPSASGERIVRIFGTGATGVAPSAPSSFSQGGASTATGFADTGATTTASTANGSAPANWAAQTISLATRTSIVIDRPPNPTDLDFILITVTAQNLGANGVICAPNDGTFVQVFTNQAIQPASGAGITVATFYTIRSVAVDEPFQFDFRTNDCSGAPIAANATAMAVRYTGVNLITPIDGKASSQSSSSTISAPALGTNFPNDAVVRFFSTQATSMSGGSVDASVGGASTSTGYHAATGGSTNAITVNNGSSTNWVGGTIALEPGGAGCSASCFYGLQDPGGVGTYYADALTAAQSSLTTNGRAGTQKVIIFLSDGDASSSSSDLGSTSKATNECYQGIQAAMAAENASPASWVFSIAYNADGSGGCSTDRSAHPWMTALCAMHLIADNPATDAALSGMSIDQAAGVVCQGAQNTDVALRFYNQPANADLTTIFGQIGVSLSSARLISNNAS